MLGHKGADILIVDDRPENLDLLSEILSMGGYNVRPCLSGSAACHAAEVLPPDLVLLDINMPDMDGFEVCRRFKSRKQLKDIPIIFISGLADIANKVTGFELGAVDYVTKPFRAEEVLARVTTHVTLQNCQRALADQNQLLQAMVDEKVEEILSARKDLERAQLAVMRAMSKVAEARDDDTGKHIDRVSAYCRALAQAMKASGKWNGTLTDEFIENLYNASPLHDIGKVAIPDPILFKPGKLTEDEFTTMKAHAEIGARTLKKVKDEFPTIQFIAVAVDIARSHHERWNGTGYPQGLTGDSIPLAARIMALADVYDALRAERCYKEAMPHEKACAIIEREAGEHFDPDIAAIFLELADTMAGIYRELTNDSPAELAVVQPLG